MMDPESIIQTLDGQRDRFELLIFSEAGKPIYTFSKREDAVTLMPLCCTLVNYAQRTQNETLKLMATPDNRLISFNNRAPLMIVVIYEANLYFDPIQVVEQVEAQIISILTAKTLRTVFEGRPTFDLKSLLYGSEKLIDAIAHLISSVKLEPPCLKAFIASSNSSPCRLHQILVPVVSMSTGIRYSFYSFLNDLIPANSKNVVFSLIFEVTHGQDSSDDNKQFQLITVCNHHKRHKLKIADLHIILALLNGSKAQLSSVESVWMPVCLPRFNQDAFLHLYISYMNEMKNCLVILSVDRDEFSNCQKARNSIEEKLEILLNDTNQKGKQLSQQLLPSTPAKQLQFLWYQTTKQVLWWQRSSEKQPSPVINFVAKKMIQTSFKTLWLKFADSTVFLGWHVPTFQLYAQFDDTITTNEAIEVIQQILNWIKREEDTFSIKDYR